MKYRIAILTAGLLFISAALGAQDGAYSSYAPYSIFGVGDLVQQGSAYNASMGGVGIATRNRRYLNSMNPAAVTARDTLSFMADFSIRQSNNIYRQGDIRSGNNTFNINSFAISFPIYRSSAVMMGIAPYSSTGYGYYSYVDDPYVVGNSGNVAYSSSGQGSIYKLYLAGGVTFWDKLSLGIEGIYYFGNILKSNKLTFSNATYNGVNSGYDIYLHANTVKGGIQYEQDLGHVKMCIGATYTLGTDLKGYVEDFRVSSGSVQSDTLKHVVDTLSRSHSVRLASELALGISFAKGEKWRGELDYIRSDWSNTGMSTVPGFSSVGSSVFSATSRESLRAGFEFIPNINDIRYYFRRCAYRAGAYVNKEYYKLDGRDIVSAGITLGATLPISKLYNNGVTIAVDMGQRGSMQGGAIRERYIGFSIGVNTYDIWFRKYRYN